MEKAIVSTRNTSYRDANPHQLTELYFRLEIMRPVVIPDKWERKKFRALDICQVCDGDRLELVSRSYAYGAYLEADDELEDWPKFPIRNRRMKNKTDGIA